MCYKPICRDTYDGLLKHGEPEIARYALGQTLLSLIFFGLEKSQGGFLDTFLNPLGRASVGAAVSSLEKTGAVKRKDGGDVAMMPLGTSCNIPVCEQLVTTVGAF